MGALIVEDPVQISGHSSVTHNLKLRYDGRW